MTGESLIELLHRGNYSCVIEKEGEVRTFQRKGIIDLYELFQTERSFLKGATVADKVIGKGAAALMVLGEVGHVYADTVSKSAATFFRRANIPVTWGVLAPFIINRRGDGKCPLEKACEGIGTPEAAYPIIQDFVRHTFDTAY